MANKGDSIEPKPSLLQKWGGFVKFSHTIFALPFALASMVLAARAGYAVLDPEAQEAVPLMKLGWPGWKLFLLILLAMITARTCAMAFNRIADRKFDAANPRTKDRHLSRMNTRSKQPYRSINGVVRL